MKVLLIGKLSAKNENNGPGAILYQLQKQLPLQGVTLRCAFFADSASSKWKALKQFVIEIFTSPKMTVNCHTEGFVIPLFVYLCSKIIRKHDYFLTLHGNYAEECKYTKVGKKEKIYFVLEGFLYRNFDNMIFVSSMQANDFAKKFARKKPVFVVENGTPACLQETKTAQKTLQHNTIRIISLGGINKRKGIFDLIPLIDFFKKNTEMNFIVDIYGNVQEPALLEDFEALCKQLNLEDSVKFCGLINSKAEVYQKLAEYDFSCALSKYDTFNVAVIESMAMGTPVICSTKCGVVDYIQDGVNGLIFDAEDAKESMRKVANIFEQCQGDKLKYTSMVNESMKIRLIATPKAMTKKYIEVFHAKDS